MKRFILNVCFLLIAALPAVAQYGKLSNKLFQEISNTNQNKLHVIVLLTNHVNWDALNLQFENEKKPISERAKQVNEMLKAVAQPQQALLKEVIRNYNIQNPENSIEWKNSWFISNCVEMELNAAALNFLQHRQEVEFIQLTNEIQLMYDAPVSKTESGNSRSVGGSEQGLKAIKAPYLWNMGYTGLGSIGYVIDTGVWPVHPAISENFMGNFAPLYHTWNYYDLPFPGDKSDAHGTHVTGTMMGLDQNNADTIGVAFKARYISTDPIVEDLSMVKGVPALISAFEWALNPDGNINTSNDIPHVINNSWGISTANDTTYCNTQFVFDAFQACEAAGIAIVFSAGNSGPNPGTISRPQYVAINPVLPFTVGALNGNQPAYPIANFSSRGPIACNVSDSLKIKPEVAAPGVDVRSCVQLDAYANYSGTSMAGPHVAGAVLLLKEAFPMATGKEILLALYHSADDLGAEGEDNTFGNGIINLQNAFDSLATQFYAVPAIQFAFDASITRVTTLDKTCSNAVNLSVEIKNVGSEVLSNLTLIYGYNVSDELGMVANNINLNQDEVLTFSVPNVPVVEGNNDLWVKLIDESGNDINALNDKRYSHPYKYKLESIPYLETFEANYIRNNNILIDNPDGKRTWDTISTNGLPSFNKFSARVRHRGYSPTTRQKDFLYLPEIDFSSGSDSLFLEFFYAYTFNNNVFSDTLLVEYSSDCAVTWNQLFFKGGTQLETFDTNLVNFIPRKLNHWKQQKIYLSDLQNSSKALFRFVTINKGGNSIFVDNAAVYRGENTKLSIAPFEEYVVNIFPNPSSDVFTIQTQSVIKHYDVIDQLGRMIANKDVNQQQFQIQTENWNQGIYYIVMVDTKGRRISKKLIKL